MKITKACTMCKKPVTFEVPDEGYSAWKFGTHIQHAMPDVAVEHREMLISGFCKECWSKIFNQGELK